MERNPQIQYKTEKEIAEYQDSRLRETIAYVAEKSPFYRRLFAENGIDPQSIKTVADLQKIPVTTKVELQRFNNDFLCVSERDVVDIVTTSGTTGDPVVVKLTENDLQRLAYNEWLSFSTAGCTRDDVLQLMTTIDRRFMAGLAYFMGARSLGMGVCRVGNGIPELQWDTIKRIGSTCGMVIPSFIMKLIDYAKSQGIDYRHSTMKKCVCIGEALYKPNGERTALGNRIHTEWPELKLYTTYASTEMQSSFTDCEYFCGGHVQPELIYVELLDENNQPVKEGEAGEVTITNFGIEGMPLVRFKTGDICYMYSSPCKCGRNTKRLSSVIGRKNQMIKYKGTTVYPPVMFDILDNIEGVANYAVEVYTNSLGTDEIKVRVGSERTDEGFVKHIKDLFRAKVRVAPQVSIETPDYVNKLTHPQMSRKPVKFFDLR
ncbi:MAG: AMP-binding protein [Bacteroidales bacterium]|jgi:phenylacetate-CoA ligase|nr:phenylacetate--CoA ligase [Bacteroidales bacterium]MBP5420661.1 AMP-binding protein [Bacteroidales bacterium]